jgi:hypothetical protein
MSESITKSPQIRVVPFSKEECPITLGKGPALFTWKNFYRFRNALLRVLGSYGTVGPSGEMPILPTWWMSSALWKPGAPRPEFYVVSDMPNRRCRWNRVETRSPWLVNDDLLDDIVQMLLDWPEWCVYFALVKGGLTVFSNRILYEGPLFEGSTSIGDLVDRCASTAQAD